MERLRVQFRQTGQLHHAYLVPGDISANQPLITAFIEEVLGAPTVGNPDYYARMFETLSVDETRELKEDAYIRPLGERRVFMIGAKVLTAQAQNALLKMLEEPPRGLHFFLLVPNADLVLPTVRSRMQILSMPHVSDTEATDRFLALPHAKRLDMLKKLLDTISDMKDRSLAADFLAGLEQALAARRSLAASGEAPSLELREALEAVTLAKRHISDPGASPKILLEYVALICPIFLRNRKNGSIYDSSAPNATIESDIDNKSIT